MTKRDSIAKEIRDLGAGYRQILRDGWVHYLSAEALAEKCCWRTGAECSAG